MIDYRAEAEGALEEAHKTLDEAGELRKRAYDDAAERSLRRAEVQLLHADVEAKLAIIDAIKELVSVTRRPTPPAGPAYPPPPFPKVGDFPQPMPYPWLHPVYC